VYCGAFRYAYFSFKCDKACVIIELVVISHTIWIQKNTCFIGQSSFIVHECLWRHLSEIKNTIIKFLYPSGSWSLKTHRMAIQWTVEQVALECVISALSVIVDEGSET
jgi:hypothetical protein